MIYVDRYEVTLHMFLFVHIYSGGDKVKIDRTDISSFSSKQ